MSMKSVWTTIQTFDNVNYVVTELFKSLLSRYQSGLETLIRGSNFFIDSVQLFHHKCHKSNFKRGG